MSTALTRRSPRRSSFPPMRSLRREMDRLFSDFFPMADLDDGDGEARTSAVWAPRMDVSETNDAYHVRLDLPGMSKSDISVSVEDHRLSISGERKEEKEEKGENYVQMERVHGNFFRSVSLPAAATEQNIKASFNNGVLTVTVPKAEDSKPRKIKIN